MLNFGHFEDLYLASIATIKDYLQRLGTLIASNFKQLDEVIFVFPNEPLRALGPIRLAWLRACLLAQQDLLESDLFTGLLSCAIDFQAANFGDAKMPPLEPQTMVSSNFSSNKGLGSPDVVERRPRLATMRGSRPQALSRGIGHFETIRGYSCGMIFALLTEKHGPIYATQSRKDTRTPELPVPDHEIEAAYQSSSNSHNLDERVKRIDTSTPIVTLCSGGMKDARVPMPTGDASQEHLYRDDGMYELDTYANVLSSSILGSAEKTNAGSHGGTLHQVPRKSLSPKRYTELQVRPLVYKIPSEALLAGGPSIQETRQPSDLPAPFHQSPIGQAGMLPPQGSFHYYTATTLQEYELDYLPLIQRRVFSREELKQPFSKLCDTPPQRPVSRSIIGRRFFNFSRH